MKRLSVGDTIALIELQYGTDQPNRQANEAAKSIERTANLHRGYILRYEWLNERVIEMTVDALVRKER